jgi:hypothetical protein
MLVMLLVIVLAPDVVLSVAAIETEFLCRHPNADTIRAMAHQN